MSVLLLKDVGVWAVFARTWLPLVLEEDAAVDEWFMVIEAIDVILDNR
jgi:hypothetical protein